LGSATSTRLAPLTTWALVISTPSARTKKPVPMPARRCSAGPPPKKNANGSTGARSTVSVWTVTTAGETRAAAVTIAVRRDASRLAAGTGAGRRAASGTAADGGRGRAAALRRRVDGRALAAERRA
jgi:hypothetical protein